MAVRPDDRRELVVGQIRERNQVSLSACRAVCAADGRWYLMGQARVQGGHRWRLYRVTDSAGFEPLGTFPLRSLYNVDVAFTGEDRLTVLGTDYSPSPETALRIWTVDFRLSDRTWSEPRLRAWCKKGAHATSSRLFVLDDGSVHLLWHVRYYQRPDRCGIFALPESRRQPIKLAATVQNGFRAVASGRRIVVAFTLDGAPNKVFFRVLEGDKPGPLASVDLDGRDQQALDPRNLVVGAADDDGIWLFYPPNKDFYQLKFVP